MKNLKTTGLVLIVIFIAFVILFRKYAPLTVKTGGSEYQYALNFINTNISTHKTFYGQLISSDGTFTKYSPYNYKDLYTAMDALDSLKFSHTLVTVKEEDQRIIPKAFLEYHIKKSIKTWQNSSFSSHVEFNDFTEYILPYRAGKESFSTYQDSIPKLFFKILDSLNKLKTPLEAVTLINSELKNRLVFDLRSHLDLSEPDMLTLIAKKKGSCESLTQCAVLTIRAFGLAGAIDECPVWAHRNAGHQWNAFLDSENKWVPFGGAEKNPDEFDTINDSVKVPKIFRHTFSVREGFSPSLENKADIPQVFRNRNRIDVTHEYVSTSDVSLKIPMNDVLTNQYVYLAVFNAEQWKIVTWSKLENGKALFKNIGNNNIIYLPVFYQKGNVIPASDPFVLTPNNTQIIKPDFGSLSHVTLEHFNKFYDIIWNVGDPEIGSKMELFYWKNKWISCGVYEIDEDRSLNFENVPEDALYWIKKHGELNTWQRIFTLKDDKQIWF